MSERYPGGFISKTAPTVTTSSAQGVWTLEQQAAYQKAGTWPFGGPFNYIEDVFSTYLYTGTGSAMTITNGIDLAGKGGLVWVKQRDASTRNHCWVDTARGTNQYIASNNTSAQSGGTSVYSFDSNGFKIGNWTDNGTTFASWTFRKQAKFFDVVTFTASTGTNTNLRVSHNLGSAPGCIIVKSTTNTNAWYVYHKSLGINKYLILNNTNASSSYTPSWGTSDPTSTDFGFNEVLFCAAVPETFVAYLYADNAGGFGLTGTDNVISCGSFTTDGSGNFSVNLGYEPQWVMIKSTNNTGVSAVQQNWIIYDNMRGFVTQPISNSVRLYPNLSSVEAASNDLGVTSTGFNSLGNMSASAPFIYIAIRRGPMKTPTTGTSVYFGSANSDTTGVKITTGFPVDLQIGAFRSIATGRFAIDRLRGASSTTTEAGQVLRPNTTGAEFASTYARYWDNTGYQISSAYADNSMIEWNFGRAPGYMDVVCYTGNGTARNVTHNLGVVPELIITANRSGVNQWVTYCANVCTTNGQYLQLHLTDAKQNSGSAMWGTPFSSAPNMTATTFSLGTDAYTNNSGANFVAYLFATCAGVSKVGSYTGTGSTNQINCGFTGGARFIMVKRTDSLGNWFVWDTARGIVAGNDPTLMLNSDAAESSVDWVDPYSAGFELASGAGNDANINGASYIYLAIA